MLFNSTHRKLHDHIDIREVPELTKKQYSVGGMTAMLDAIGDTIQKSRRELIIPLKTNALHILFVRSRRMGRRMQAIITQRAKSRR